MIDLRSDTVTKPSEGMLKAMFMANVGDDVYGEDETVRRLEQRLAAEFGKEAGLFFPSGTMANQVAIRVHSKPSEEVICADNAHVFKYEGGGMAANAGVQARTLPSVLGKISATQIAEAINAEDIHYPNTTLLCLENTSNRGGGSVYQWEELTAIHRVCSKHNVPMHLDGARVYNALAVANYLAVQLGGLFASISICLSKGLGAPVGSVLVGSDAFIYQAKRIRKMMGGGMRQAGYLAAAGLYALDNNVKGLLLDHAHAQQVAEVLSQHPMVDDVLPVETNIIIFKLMNMEIAEAFHQYLLQHHIKANRVSPAEIRFVFHLDVTPAHVTQLVQVIQQFEV